MNRPVALVLALFLVAGQAAALAQGPRSADGKSALIAAPAAGKEQLPIRRVTLYRSGVGSFERRGLVDGSATVQLRFTTDQVNDILKSMFVLDLSKGKGTIDGISYASKEPLARRLASFGIDISNNPSSIDLLSRLRGTPVRLSMPEGEVAGTILAVETRATVYTGGEKSGPAKFDLPWISLLTDKGVRSVNLSSVTGYEILDPALATELNKALAALAEYRADRTKTVNINLRGEGAREIVVGYVQEAPVWKTSYRLVLPDLPAAGSKSDKPKASGGMTLQGWAIVENTSDEDWSNVRLSLVSGRPVSFRMDLYEPLYTERPLLAVPTIPGVMPRIFEGGDASKDKQVARLESRSAGRADRAGAPAPAAAKAPPGRGTGGINASVAMDAAEEKLSADDMSFYGAAAQAQGVSAGELFQFELDAPVTIERQKSAMLPILAAGVDGRRVSIFSTTDGSKNPMRGVEITNTSGMQLMPGPISVFDGAAYAGDAQVGHVPAGDKRLIAYSVDLEVDVTRNDSFNETVSKIRVVNGLLEFTKQQVSTAKLTFVNKDTQRGRTLIVENPRMPGWDLATPAKAYEQTDSLYRFDVDIAANQKGEFTIAQNRTEQTTLQFTDFSLDSMMAYSKNGAASRAVIDAFRDVAARQSIINDLQRQMADLENERGTITNDQARIRNNMGGLERSSKLYNEYVATLTEQEARLKAITSQANQLRGKVKAAEDDLRLFLSTLNVQ